MRTRKAWLVSIRGYEGEDVVYAPSASKAKGQKLYDLIEAGYEAREAFAAMRVRRCADRDVLLPERHDLAPEAGRPRPTGEAREEGGVAAAAASPSAPLNTAPGPADSSPQKRPGASGEPDAPLDLDPEGASRPSAVAKQIGGSIGCRQAACVAAGAGARQTNPRAAGAARQVSSLFNLGRRLLRRLPALLRQGDDPAAEWRRLAADYERARKRHDRSEAARRRLSAHVHTMLREGW